ncbi:MAG TPA: hypothetical protein VIF15_19305 [Polyangiaceae bacterium]|jgi:hypothetical protein
MPSVVVRSLKQLWHRDLVARPATHAWVLNLYRAGERYPETVDDYFPSRHVPWPELAASFDRHREDERRHDRMYERAIRRMGQPVLDLGGALVFNQVIRDCTPLPWRIDEADDEAARRLKLAHFCAHAHYLEKRITSSLRWHLDACERARSEHAGAVVAHVLEDEDRHVAYTHDAVGELLDRRTAACVLELHRRSEARANLRFSAGAVRVCMREFGAALPANRRALWKLCALVMEEGAARA